MSETIQELLASGESFAEHFARCGYDTADFRDVTIRKDGEILFYFNLEDDFQRDITVSLRYKHEWMMRISGETVQEIRDQVYAWPSRKQRELRVLARQLASVKGMSEKVADLEVQEIIEGILSSGTQIKNLLEQS